MSANEKNIVSELEEKPIYLGFKGTADAVLDENNRMSIPSKYRDDLGRLFVGCCTGGEFPCLYFFPLQNWKDLANELHGISNEIPRTPELEWRRRNLYKNAEDITADGKGRFTLPPQLCRLAGLKGEVLFIGNMKRVEVWNPDTYAAAEAKSVAEAYNTGRIPDLNY